MDIKLELIFETLGAYQGLLSKRRETDYTGRWKIVNTNGERVLYIECFDIVPKFKDVYITKTYVFGLFQRTYYVGKKEYGVKAKVYWVHEKDLVLTTKEEFINQCGECND